MFDWLRRKKPAPAETPGVTHVPGQKTETLDPVKTAALAAKAQPMTAADVHRLFNELGAPIQNVA